MVDAIRDLRREWRDHRTIEIAVGPHAAYSLSRPTLESVAALVADDRMLVHIHVAEQPGEAAARCVWVTPGDIELFAERGVGVAHCPASNGRHASGIAPVDDMRRLGVKVGTATDEPASHDRLDLFEDIRTAARFARIRAMGASRMTAADLLSMVTSEAADAVGRPDLGRLTPGSRADMVSLDVNDDGFEPVLSGLANTISLGFTPGFWVACALALIVSAAFGLVLYVVVFRPLRTAPPGARVVASLGVQLAIVLLVAKRVGTKPLLVPKVCPGSKFKLGDTVVKTDRIWLAATIIVLALLLGALFKFTRFGLATRAAAESEKGAAVSRISPARVAAINWLLSAVVAGLAGIPIAPLVSLARLFQ